MIIFFIYDKEINNKKKKKIFFEKKCKLYTILLYLNSLFLLDSNFYFILFIIFKLYLKRFYN